jgi:magnesium chelatase family protein
MNPCPCGYLGEARCRCTEERVRDIGHACRGRCSIASICTSRCRGPRRRRWRARRPGRRARGRESRQRGAPASARAGGLSERAARRARGDTPLCTRTRRFRAAPARGEASRSVGAGLPSLSQAARSIADIASADRIDVAHVSEALSLRSPDRPRPVTDGVPPARTRHCSVSRPPTAVGAREAKFSCTAHAPYGA